MENAKKYKFISTAGQTKLICTAETGKQIFIDNIKVSGGENGGNVTFSDSNNLSASTTFKLELTVGAHDSFILDELTALPSGESYYFTCDTSGVQIYVSALEYDVES
jgi:hypothetical protein